MLNNTQDIKNRLTALQRQIPDCRADAARLKEQYQWQQSEESTTEIRSALDNLIEECEIITENLALIEAQENAKFANIQGVVKVSGQTLPQKDFDGEYANLRDRYPRFYKNYQDLLNQLHVQTVSKDTYLQNKAHAAQQAELQRQADRQRQQQEKEERLQRLEPHQEQISQLIGKIVKLQEDIDNHTTYTLGSFGMSLMGRDNNVNANEILSTLSNINQYLHNLQQGNATEARPAMRPITFGEFIGFDTFVTKYMGIRQNYQNLIDQCVSALSSHTTSATTKTTSQEKAPLPSEKSPIYDNRSPYMAIIASLDTARPAPTQIETYEHNNSSGFAPTPKQQEHVESVIMTREPQPRLIINDDNDKENSSRCCSICCFWKSSKASPENRTLVDGSNLPHTYNHSKS